MHAELDAYFERIGWSGSREPTLETLRCIVLAHTRAIPFENLDVLLGRRIFLDEPAIVKKLVHQRRGGYCFEQNGLLLSMLTSLGFDVAPLSARVRLQRPRDFVPPRTHMFLRVELAGESWLADVGVGGLSLTAPLRLDTADAQTTPHETRRIVRENQRLYHQALLAGEWQDVCEFTLEEMPPIDRELANWFTNAHPDSHFKNRLLAARAGPNGERFTLLNQEFTHRRADGAVTTTIATPEELLAILAEHFGLRFPADTRFDCPALKWS
ncbi:MAG: arylamine N-acetyltransferase [Planctomycetes bacterium]|nr:arylamine N-acetyltransferase [Planctomycetota bacterium]